MKIIKAGYEIPDELNATDIYKKIERAGRICYKSKITKDSARKFVAKLVKDQHEAMLEHAGMTVIFTVDRGVSHEMVRHRMASFAQESTRYCNYSQDKFGNEITVIEPLWFNDISEHEKELCRRALDDYEWNDEVEDFLNNTVTDKHKMYARWYDACTYAEAQYFNMLELGATPQEARSVLPHSLKTDIVVTANMREWRHILNLRAAGTTGKPHPQIEEVMVSLLEELTIKMPELFGDIWRSYMDRK